MTSTNMMCRPAGLDDVLPVTFGKSFGWLHPGRCDTGVIICHATGWDAHGSYGAFRRMAAELASLGYPTLRFDYPGVGDALELDGDEPCAAWLDSVGRACDHMRATRVKHIVLCGHRVGALLAAFVAVRRDDVSGLILVDPVALGTLYLRELALEQTLTSDAPGPEDGRIEAEGIVLTSASAAPFRALSLLSLQRIPASRILILASQKRPANAKIADRLASLGAEVEQDAIEPMREFSTNGLIDPKPPLDRIHRWLGPATPSSFSPAHPPSCAVELNGGAGFTEHPIRFGAGQRLFGMLCRPRSETLPGFVLVIGTAGGTCHHGNARFTVLLARRLAEAGYASLRMDYAGIGESVSDQPTHVYATDRRTDVAEAIEALQLEGFSRFGAGGLCSGAFHSLQASLADRRIETLVMLNPSTFSWSKDQDFAKFIQSSTRSTGFYMETMMGRKGWKRLLRGELDVFKAIRTVWSHMARRLRALGSHAAERAGWQGPGATPRQAMARVSARGVRTLVVIGTIDAGADVLKAHFGSGGHWLAALPGTTLRLTLRVDHALTRVFMQEAIAATLIDFLRARLDSTKPDLSKGRVLPTAGLPGDRAAA